MGKAKKEAAIERTKKEAKKVEEKAGKAFGGKKAPNFTGPGILAHILSCVTKGGMTRADILKSLEKNFPDRDIEKMKRTVGCQIGGVKRPLRMEREKKVKFNISADGKFSLAK